MNRLLQAMIVGVVFCLMASGLWIARQAVMEIGRNIVKCCVKACSILSQDKRQPWMTVFVHGSFCSSAGFLDYDAVARDDLQKSLYKRVVYKMREDQIFYKNQIILERGLVHVDPTFDKGFNGCERKAAFPVLKAYGAILDSVAPGEQENHYYLFGWTGLMSQKRRRSEAIRLYNAIVEEREKLRDRGIDPKIRIFAHSHGGNVVLNLAGVNEAMNGAWRSLPEAEDDERIGSVREHFDELFSALPSKEIASSKSGQKKLDYYPEDELVIDEFVMFGTPVQIETAYFAKSPFFKFVLNAYSDEDMVQDLDWVSTCQGCSEKRFEQIDLEPVDYGNGNNRFIQARITSSLEERGETGVGGAVTQKVAWWKAFIGLGCKVRKTMDPTHKELWFVVPPDVDEPPFIKPIPTVVFAPMMLKLLSGVDKDSDFDVDLSFSGRLLLARAIDQKNGKEASVVSVPMDVVVMLRERLRAWIPSSKDSGKVRCLVEDCIHVCRNSTE